MIMTKAYSQDKPQKILMPGAITGLVLDSELKVPLEYANIVLYDKANKAQITGTITNPNGIFQLSRELGSNLYILHICRASPFLRNGEMEKRLFRL